MYLTIILVFIIGNYLLNTIAETLNAAFAKPEIPAEFKNYYDAEGYKCSQEYLKENIRFKIIQATLLTSVIILLIASGGFNSIDRLARKFNQGPILTGLIFAGILFIGSQLIEIPFSLYHTFVIEAKFGFNRTTPRTFVFDTIKGLLLTMIIGATVFAAIIWFFMKMESGAWLLCWLTVTLIELFLLFVAPTVILPLFNKFIPLADGPLKQAIQEYARAHNFRMKGIFQMDGSRRSSKANAFFIGFGKFRRIVLFDTLIAKHTPEELVSILAHEMGHYKKRHYTKHIAISILSNGLMLFILSFFINNQGLFSAFKMEQRSIYAGLLFFGFLYTPLSLVFSITAHVISRKHEYEADRYAVTTYPKPEAFITALKKLTVDNLSNLTPHPLTVFLHYSHPPVLERIKAIRGVAKVT